MPTADAIELSDSLVAGDREQCTNVSVDVEIELRRLFFSQSDYEVMDKPTRSSHTVAQFLDWRENKTLRVSPKFQRRSVWSIPQRSYLIDTLLRQMPVPPIYLRNLFETETKRMIHEVIDGQQRIQSILDFVDGRYSIAKNLDAPYSGKRFDDLSKAQKQIIFTSALNCEEFHAISDEEVFEVFRRMNTYSTPLNKQELRHGQFFGRFSQSCHSLAREYLSVWRNYRIFTEEKIARMAEVQLTSALLIAAVAGIQDKNDSIGDFYEEYDVMFPKKSTYEGCFRRVMDSILDTFEDSLVETQFRKAAFFYTLFCTVYHRMYGLPKEDLATPKKKRLTNSDADGLRIAVERLSDVITAARKSQKLSNNKSSGASLFDDEEKLPSYPARYQKFVDACLSQTDNVKPRRQRFETLYTEAFW